VRPGEVVELEVERDRGGMVLDLPRERIGEPGEPTEVHPHGEILPFHVARGDVGGVGVARHGTPLNAGADSGRVSALVLGGVGAVLLDDLPVVHRATEGPLHSEDVGLVAVRGQLSIELLAEPWISSC
jgi:hypothetical protein